MNPYRFAVIAAAAMAVTACAMSPAQTSVSPAGGAVAGRGAAGFQRTTLNGKPCVKIPVDRIGIQLWAVSGLFNIPAGTGLAATASADAVDKGLAQVAAIGYKNVEPYSTYGLSAAQFKALLDKHGLKSIASHTTVTDENWDATMDYALAMGQKYLGSSLPPGHPQGYSSLDDLLQEAKTVNSLGQRAAAKGLKLYLHNHTFEFDERYLYDINKDGKPVMTPAWEIMAAETDPRYVSFEIDVNWLYRGLQGMGDQADLVNFVKKHADRVVLLHVKEPDGAPSPGRGELDVGRGNMDWPAVFGAASNVQYYIYEVDPSLLPTVGGAPPDLVKSAQIAFNYMTCTA